MCEADLRLVQFPSSPFLCLDDQSGCFASAAIGTWIDDRTDGADLVCTTCSFKPSDTANMLRGKTFLVTGSTDGIGKQTVTKLAAAGADVLIHGRNADKVAYIIKQVSTAAAGGKISSYTFDMSSFADVKKFAEAVRADHPSINVLINNAGIFSKQKAFSKDGIELTWAVNALAPFLLTSLLLDTVTERIVNVGSMALASSMDFNNLQQEKGFSGHNAYSVSKLANLMFSNQLAPMMRQRGVTVNCVHRGIIATNVLHDGWGGGGSDAKGADDVYNLATGDALGQQTGLFFAGHGVVQQPAVAEDSRARQQLWHLMEEQTSAEYSLSGSS